MVENTGSSRKGGRKRWEKKSEGGQLFVDQLGRYGIQGKHRREWVWWRPTRPETEQPGATLKAEQLRSHDSSAVTMAEARPGRDGKRWEAMGWAGMGWDERKSRRGISARCHITEKSRIGPRPTSASFMSGAIIWHQSCEQQIRSIDERGRHPQPAVHYFSQPCQQSARVCPRTRGCSSPTKPR